MTMTTIRAKARGREREKVEAECEDSVYYFVSIRIAGGSRKSGLIENAPSLGKAAGIVQVEEMSEGPLRAVIE